MTRFQELQGPQTRRLGNRPNDRHDPPMPRIHPDDLTPQELDVQLELATNAIRFAANYQHHHGRLPYDALTSLDYVRDAAKKVIGANGPSIVTDAMVQHARNDKKNRGR